MRCSVLIIDTDRYESDRFQHVLEARRHRVCVTPHFNVGLAAVSSRPFDVVVVEWATLPRDIGDLQAKLRQVAPSANPFVIGMVGADAVDALRILERGADDLVRRPVSGEDLVARVEAPARHRRFVERAPLAELGWARSLDVSRVPGWNDLDALLARPLSGLLARRIRPCAARTPSSAPALWSEVVLSVPSEEVAIRVAIRFDLAGVEAASRALLGTAALGPADYADVLGEMNNTLVGALKDAASGVSTMTAGLPRSLRGAPDARRSGRVVSRSFEVEGMPGTVDVSLACFSVEPFDVPADNLEEGMVVARDILGGSGALLVAAGTRITTSTAERLSRALGGRFGVQIVASVTPGSNDAVAAAAP